MWIEWHYLDSATSRKIILIFLKYQTAYKEGVQ